MGQMNQPTVSKHWRQ